MNSNKCGVYKITCLVTNKVYIGSSNNISKRFGDHRWQLRNNKHANCYLQNAWNKYGEESFVFEILELCNKYKQFELEQQYLNEFKPFAKFDNGYNFLQTTVDLKDRSNIEFIDYDDFGMPHKIHQKGCLVEMPITLEDYMCKSKKELQNEYDGYVAMLDLYEDMVMCDPDYE